MSDLDWLTLWSFRAEGYGSDGDVFAVTQTVSEAMLAAGGEDLAGCVERDTLANFRGRFWLEPEAAYWQLDCHLRTECDD